MSFVDRKTFEAQFTEPYWRNRWPYLERAIELGRRVAPKHVLEIGPNGRELFLGAHTLDIEGRPTYLHDASLVPWPISDKRYDLVIALQVWEHLSDPYAAWQELRRVGRAALMSFPLGWAVGDATHDGIDEELIDAWAGGAVPEAREIVGQRTARPRLVCLWRFG